MRAKQSCPREHICRVNIESDVTQASRPWLFLYRSYQEKGLLGFAFLILTPRAEPEGTPVSFQYSQDSLSW